MRSEPPHTTPRPAARGRSISLKRVILTGVAVQLVVALVVTFALVHLTTLLHRTSATVAESLESIRLTEDLQRDLLLHARGTDPLAKAEIEQAIAERLAAERGSQRSSEHAKAFAETDRAVRGYLGGAGGPDALEDAYRAVGRLADVHLDDARLQQARIARLDRLADALGYSAAGLLVVTFSALSWWLHTRALRPVISLGAAMERFARGEADNARADETGPAELSAIASRYNDLLEALGRQRELLLAFLGGIAHDLRNPLSALAAAVGTVHPERPLPPEHRLRATIALMGRQIGRLERIVSDFVDTARIEAGQLSLDTAAEDLRQIASSSVALFEQAGAAHRLRLVCPAAPVVARCDAHRIEQVLNNLLSNAIKYSSAGSEVAVSVRQEADSGVVSVSDEGIGIPQDELSHLFMPFKRGRASSSGIPGTGLGLFVAQRIAVAHGGRLSVRSSPGRGSTFEVRLPLASEAASQHTKARAASPERSAPIEAT